MKITQSMGIIELFTKGENTGVEQWNLRFPNSSLELMFIDKEKLKGDKAFYGYIIVYGIIFFLNLFISYLTDTKYIHQFIWSLCLATLLFLSIYAIHKFQRNNRKYEIWRKGGVLLCIDLLTLEMLIQYISNIDNEVCNINSAMQCTFFLFLLILINFSYCFSIQRLHIEVFQVLVPNYLIILLRVSISNISKVYNEYLFLIYLLFGYSFVYFFVFLHERCLRSIFLLKLKDKEKISNLKVLFDMVVNPMFLLGEDKIFFINSEFKKQFSLAIKPTRINFNTIIKTIISEDNKKNLLQIVLEIENNRKTNTKVVSKKHLGEYNFDWNGRKTYEITYQLVKYKSKPGILFHFQNVTIAKEQQKEKLSKEFRNLLLTTASHELRTPLNGIFGNLQLLDTCTDPDDIHRKLFFIRNSSEFLLNIINNILDYCKYEAGNLEVSSTETRILNIVEECKKMINFQCKQRGVDLQIDLSPDIPEIIYTDGPRIKQVLLNLLANAVKYTYHGSIKIVGRYLEDMLNIQIIDTGIGIPEDKKKELFKIFGREMGGMGTMDSGGKAGLGLTISQALLSKLGTGLTYRSNNNQGSIFSLNIYTNQRKSRAHSFSNKGIGQRIAHKKGSFHIPPMKKLTGTHTSGSLNNNSNSLDLTLRPLFSPSSNRTQKQATDGLFTLHKCNSKESSICKSHSPNRGDQRMRTDSIGSDWVKEVNEESDQSTPESSPYIPHTPNDIIQHKSSIFSNKSKLSRTNTLIGKDLSTYALIPKSSTFHIQNSHIQTPAFTPSPQRRTFFQPRRSISGVNLITQIQELCACADLLIVDDSAFNLEILKGLLKKLGYTTLKANNGKQAIEVATTMLSCGCNKLQGILMDIEMPIMNGFEATIELKNEMKDDILPLIPIVAVTAYTDEDTREKCFLVGMDDYISKPIFLEELKECLINNKITPTLEPEKAPKKVKQHRQTLLACQRPTLITPPPNIQLLFNQNK